ncbi:hypothetical protein [Paenibacillus sp. N3.4]|uniref:hypothetical protein n=1 Tax=Paenibacillus sp. N3.4 TaxID=2603222 RepID=UPI0011CB67D5|nr:hypothetical protein [Paenibacillus sp. N3.4]TXK84604.1 hypothetical protein FU659_08265 [Paenibacillus sp. N3.4]
MNNVTVPTKQTYPNTLVVDVTSTAIQMLSSHPNVISVDTSANSVTLKGNSLVSDLLSQIQSSNGTTQTYSVTNSINAAKNADQILVTGDILVVTAQNGTTKRDYQIVVDIRNTAIQVVASGHPNVTAIDTKANSVTILIGSLVSNLLNQIESTNGTTQNYSVTDSSNAAKIASQILETGDILVVTAEDGTTTKKYAITVPNPEPTDIVLLKAADVLSKVKKSSGVTTLSTSATNGITYLQTSSSAVGEWIEFDVLVPAGTYNASFQYKTSNSGRATVQPYVNGVATGSPVNEMNATANLFIPVDLGQVTFATAGTYPVRFVVTTTGVVVIDYIKFELTTPATGSSNTDIQLNATHPNVTAVDTAAHTVTTVYGTIVAQLTAQISATDSSTQTYVVKDSSNALKGAGTLVNGDKLVVTASDKSTTVTYNINVSPSTNTNIQMATIHPNVTAVDNAAKP